MALISLFLAATLFGGMVFFSFGFAPVLFAQLPMAQVRPLLRGTFPYYYLAVIALAAVAALAALAVSGRAALIFFAVALSTVYARQVLMPQINRATDADDTRGFQRLHGASVVLQLVQIAVAGWALVLVA